MTRTRNAHSLAPRTVLCAAILWLVAFAANADTIKFRNGSTIQGTVVKQTRTHVHVRYPGGLIVQYPKEDIVEVVPSETPADKMRRLFSQGQFDKVIDAFRQAGESAAAPASQEFIWFGLSRAWLAKGRYTEAAKRYMTLLRKAPNTKLYPYLPLPSGSGPVAHEKELLAYLHEAIGDAAESPLVRQAAKLMSAAVHCAAARYSEAESLWTQAKRSPDNRVQELAALVQAYAHCRLEQWKIAAGLLNNALWRCDEPMRPVLSYWLGKAELGRRRYEPAAAAFLRVDMMHQPPPLMQADALFLAAQCFESLNQPGRAAALYKRLLQQFPGLPQGRAARKRALALGQP